LKVLGKPRDFLDKRAYLAKAQGRPAVYKLSSVYLCTKPLLMRFTEKLGKFVPFPNLISWYPVGLVFASAQSLPQIL